MFHDKAKRIEQGNLLDRMVALKSHSGYNYQTSVNLSIFHDLSFINKQQEINMNFPDVDNLSTSTDPNYCVQHRKKSLGVGKESQPRRDRRAVGG